MLENNELIKLNFFVVQQNPSKGFNSGTQSFVVALFDSKPNISVLLYLRIFCRLNLHHKSLTYPQQANQSALFWVHVQFH